MLSTISQLQHIVSGKVVTLLCDCNIGLGDLKEALFQFQKFVGKVEDDAKAAAVQKTVPQTPEPEVQVEQPQPDIQPVQ